MTVHCGRLIDLAAAGPLVRTLGFEGLRSTSDSVLFFVAVNHEKIRHACAILISKSF
jgi:hypothetical protein